MPNIINQMIVRELTDSLSSAEGLVIVSLAGLTVAETEGLRVSLAEQGVRLRVVRSRLARIALRSRGLETPDGMLAGSVALAWGSPEETIHAAKVLVKSEPKKAGKVAMRGGLLEGMLLDSEQATQLAELPSRDELRAKLLSVIAGPARSLVTLFAAPASSLVRVVQAHVDASPAAEASAEAASGEGAQGAPS